MDEEIVEYSFTGDVSSLESATKEAIDLLDSYSAAIKSVVDTDTFKASKTSFTSFSRTLNGVIKQVNSLTDSLNKSGSEAQRALSSEALTIKEFNNDIRGTMDYFKSGNIIDTRDLKFLTDYLKVAKEDITRVADRAKILSTNMSKLKSLKMPKTEEQKTVASAPEVKVPTSVPAATKISDAFKASAASVDHSVMDMISSLDRMVFNRNAINYAREVEESYGKAFKSARESARAFFDENDQDFVFAQRLDDIEKKSKQIAENVQSTLGKLSSAFEPFKAAVEETKSKLQSMKDTSESAMNRVKQVVEAAGSGFRRFKGDTEDAADSEEKAAARAQALYAAFSKLPKIFSTLASSTSSVARFFNKVKNSVLGATNSLKYFIPTASRTSSILKSIAKLAAGISIGTAISDSVKSATNYIENLNLFTVAMGDAAAEALAFIDAMSELYGMDPSNLYRYAGYFNQLTDAIGMATNESKTISLSLTKAANDIASLFNVQIEQVVNDLASGMQGMARAVRKYGMDIRVATLQQTALKYGFEENVESASEANRQALRFLTMMDQAKNATKQVTSGIKGAASTMGDFARNIETPANQLRILKEQASQVARAFGNFFIPVMQKVLYVVNGVLMAIKILLQFLGALAGLDIGSFGGEVSKGADEAADSVAGIGGAAGGAEKALKKLLAPFDELNVLAENEPGGGGGAGSLGDLLDPNLAAAIEAMSLGLDEIRMKALDVRDAILELLGLSFEDGEIKVTIGGFIDDLINLWNAADYRGFGARVAEFINQGIAWGVEHTDPSIYESKIKKVVSAFTNILNGFIAEIDTYGLGNIAGNLITNALNVAFTFLDTFDYRVAALKLMALMQGTIDSVDWRLLGDSIGAYLVGALTFGLTLIQSTPWGDITDSLRKVILRALIKVDTFITGYDWGSIGDSFSKGINSIFRLPWQAAASVLVNGFNSIVNVIYTTLENIEWEKIGKKFGALFTGVLNNIEFEEIGISISTLLNGIMQFIHGWLQGYQWGTLSKRVATGLSSMIKNIDAKSLGKNLSDLVSLAITEGISFLRNFNWTGLGEKVIEFILSIDWLGLLKGLVEFIFTTLRAAFKLLWGMLKEIVSEIGGNIVEGLKQGIVDGLSSIGEWLKANLIDPIVNWVKNLFGIASPSTVFAEIAGFLIEGLKQGIVDAITGIGEWIQTNLVDPVVNGVKSFFGIDGSGSSSVFYSIGSDLLAGLFNGLSNIGNRVYNWGKNILTQVEDVFRIGSPSKEFEVIGEFLNAGLFLGMEDTSELSEVYDSLIDLIAGQFFKLPDKIKGKIEELVSWLTSTFNDIFSSQQKFTNNIVKLYTTMATQSVSRIQTIIRALNSIPRNITTVHTVITKETSELASTAAAVAMPHFATGGVVNKPTTALIGEGNYSEAVIPLDDSPQMQDLINKIVDSIDKKPPNSGSPVEVRVYIGDKEWDAFTYKSSERGKKIVGAKQIDTN